MLVELDLELPLLNIFQYRLTLAENGFLHVNQLVDEEVGRQLRTDLSIPLRAVIQLQSCAVRLMHHTQKLKQED